MDLIQRTLGGTVSVVQLLPNHRRVPIGSETPVRLRTQVYRYFFYGWLFRDADTGDAALRSSARRHNQAQRKWLPLYMARWAVLGALVAALETFLEHRFGSSVTSAMLALVTIFVVMYELVTGICWAFLGPRRN
jgi:hypothetical protein